MARQKTKICPSCRQAFRARRDAITCSNRCRKRLYRAKQAMVFEAKNLKAEAKQALHHLEQSIENRLSSPGHLEKGFIGEETTTTAPITTSPSSAPPTVSTPAPSPLNLSSIPIPKPYSPPTGQAGPPVAASAPPLPLSTPHLAPNGSQAPPPRVVSQLRSTGQAPKLQAVPLQSTPLSPPLPPAPSLFASQAGYKPQTNTAFQGTIPVAKPITSILSSSPIFHPATTSPIPHTPGQVIAPSPAKTSTEVSAGQPLSSTQPLSQAPPITALNPSPAPPPLSSPKLQTTNNNLQTSSKPRLSLPRFRAIYALPAIAAITLISLSAIALFGSSPPPTAPNQAALGSLPGTTTTITDSGLDTIHLNLNTVISEGHSLTVTGQLITQGDITSAGAILASGGTSSLSNDGLIINSVNVCTAAGCQVLANQAATGLVFTGDADTLQGNPAAFFQNASNLNTGTLSLARLPAAVTTQGNSFNGANQLLKLDGSGRLALNQASAAFTLDVNGDINLTAGSSYRLGGATICTTAGCTASSGSADYIQNNTSLQTANYAIQSASTGSVTALIRAAASQSANLLQLNNAANTLVLSVGPTGNTLIQPSTNSINAFSVQNAAGTSLLIGADTLNARVAIARAVPPDYTLDVGGDINTSTGLRVAGNLVCSSTCSPGSGSDNYIQNQDGGASVQTANFAIQPALGTTMAAYIRGASGQSADLLHLVGKAAGDVNQTVATFSASGAVLFKNAVDSTTAFQIQNVAGSSLLIADSTNLRITLGSASATPVILVLGNKNTDGDPTCTTGGVYYNSNFNQFRGCVNGAWTTFASADGWTYAAETWTYASADSPTFTFTVSGDQTSKYSPGMRIKLTQSSTVKYFIITAVSYSSPNTTLTVYGGTDYTLANATISANYYSAQKGPVGFPLNPVKWTVETRSTAYAVRGSGYTADTWYDLTASVNLVVPIGAWRLRYEGLLWNESAGNVKATLSTSNNSETDSDFRSRSAIHTAGEGQTVGREKHVVLAAKATHYLLAQAPGGGNGFGFEGSKIPTIIRAVCAYL